MTISPEDIRLCIEDHPPGAADPQPMAEPIVQTSLFAYPTYEAIVEAFKAENRNPIYTRGLNPTVDVLERKLASLEQGEACKCFGSGIGAVSAVILGLLESGDHILFVNHVYGPTIQLAKHLERFGITHDQSFDLDAGSVERSMKPNTKLVWLENPGTMMFHTLDLSAIAQLARSRGALTCVDNSWASPLFQKPIREGIDIVVHSATKYIGGHSDVVAGAAISSEEIIKKIFFHSYMLNGAILAPHEAWLLLRGLRTLPVRMQQHETDALKVAEYLRDRSDVASVNHPAFGRPSASLSGCSGVFSFEIANGEYEQVRDFINGLKRFRIGVSWGGVESIVIAPNRGTNLDYLDAQSIPHGLVRLSVGLEGADVLIEDIAQSLDTIH